MLQDRLWNEYQEDLSQRDSANSFRKDSDFSRDQDNFSDESRGPMPFFGERNIRKSRLLTITDIGVDTTVPEEFEEGNEIKNDLRLKRASTSPF